jgi:hypothetical protein
MSTKTKSEQGLALEWQNEHPSPKNEGWWWYWHPDIRDPTPIRIMFSRDPEDFGWKYLGTKYPAEDSGKEWWRPMADGLEGPLPPDVSGKN